VIAAGAWEELRALARRLGAPVISTVMGRGAIDERDPLFHSVLPDRRRTAEVLRAADVILAVGCRFGHRSVEKLDAAPGPHQTLIHLDLDPAVIGRLFKAHLALVGDARAGLQGILAALGDGPPAAGWDRAWLAARRAEPGPRFTGELAALIASLRDTLTDDTIVVCDQTGLAYWLEWRFPVRAPRTFLYPVGSATLGYGVPAAIGARIGRPDRPVLCVVGDGGFLYSVNELATAVKYRVPVVVLVLNDNRYGAIKWLQERIFGRWGEADLVNPDLVGLARAFGCRGARVESPAALPGALREAFAGGGPAVVELPLAIEPPWEM
jgi:acetolactate synthase-1/2/3 large subunit